MRPARRPPRGSFVSRAKRTEAVDELIRRGIPAKSRGFRIQLTNLEHLPEELAVFLVPSVAGDSPAALIQKCSVHVRVSRDSELERDDAIRLGRWLVWRVLYRAKLFSIPPPPSPDHVGLYTDRKGSE